MKAHKITVHGPVIVRVRLDAQASVLLLDPANYSNFQQGQPYKYMGGWYTHNPVEIPVPCSGDWYILVGTNGNGRVRYTVDIV